jgi:putative MATE family efflux protein
MSTENKNIKMMSEEKIPKVLLKLGVPVIIGMLVTAFYSVVDAIFLGGLGTSQMAAVSVTFPLAQLILGVGYTFGCGAAPYISRLLGQKNLEQANRSASTAFFSSLFFGIIAIIATLCFLDKILILFGATSTILPYAREFAVIFIAGSILNIINVTLNNIVTSTGASKISMTAMLLSAVLNIILEPIFIYTFSLGIKGAAIATVVAQSITTIVYIWYFLRGNSCIKISLRYFTFDKNIYSTILKVGILMCLFQVLSSTSIALINTAASHYGDYAVAAMGIVTRVTTLVSYVVFGYSKGFQVVAGYSYGARNYERLKEAVSVSMKWTTWFCGITAFLLEFFSNPILSIFSKDTAVISIGSRALKANSFMFIFFGFQIVYSTLFIAMGKFKEGGLLSIARQSIFFIPTIFILPQIMGLNGVIFTQAIADLLATILTAILAVNLKKVTRSDMFH